MLAMFARNSNPRVVMRQKDRDSTVDLNLSVKIVEYSFQGKIKNIICGKEDS